MTGKAREASWGWYSVPLWSETALVPYRGRDIALGLSQETICTRYERRQTMYGRHPPPGSRRATGAQRASH